jgi:hypothetical protein
MTLHTLMTLCTILAALGAAVSAVFAAIYTRLTYSLVRLATDPKVIVYTRDDPDRPSILVLIVENIGRDVAESITFTPSRPIPSKAFGLTPNDAPAAGSMTDGPLVDGIPVLGPSATRLITWGQFGGLRKALGDAPLELALTYRSGKKVFHGHATLEVKSYASTDASTRPHVVVAQSLKKIAESFEQVTATLEQNLDRRGDDQVP